MQNRQLNPKRLNYPFTLTAHPSQSIPHSSLMPTMSGSSNNIPTIHNEIESKLLSMRTQLKVGEVIR